MKEPAVKTMTVRRAADGVTLQEFLASEFALSRREAKSLIDARRVWVNRRQIWMARHTVRAGDTVDVRTAGVTVKSREGKLVRETAPAKLRILVETPDFLVIDKPAHLLSVGKGSAEELMRAQTGNAALRAAHRLDRDTTGCLLMAKGEAAFEAAVGVFKTRRVTKIYHAVVLGRYERTASTAAEDLDGLRAVTHITRLIATRAASFLKIRIETGRTHQIRRHLSLMHFPVAGDSDYGTRRVTDARALQVPRQMLHASALELRDPVDPHREIKAHSPLPADFRRTLQLFGMGK